MTSWQRELLDAFYTLAKGRQSGFEANPLPFIELAAMALLNGAVGFYEPLDLIDIWRELDQAMLAYWAEKRKERDEREAKKLEREANRN